MSADLIKMLGIALLCVAASLSLKKLGSPLSSAVISVGIISLLFFSLPKLGEVVSAALEIESVDNAAEELFRIILKVCAAAIVAETASDVAASAGETYLSKTISFAGRCEIIVLSLPLVKELVNCAKSIAGA